MDLKSGLPWWLIKNGLSDNYKALLSDLEKEVVIIGSGITGALTAHFLCKEGIKCVVVDKRMSSTGSTPASTAQLQYEIDTLLCDLIDQVGTENAVESYKLCLESISKLEEIIKELKIDCDFENRSSLFLASSKKDAKILEEEFEVRRKYNLPVEFLDDKKLLKKFNIKRPAALYNNVSAQVDAYTLCKKILEHHIKKSGLKVFSYTEVKKIINHKNGIEIKTDKGFSIKAKKLVCAPGFESQFFLKEKVMQLNSTYVIISRPVEQHLWKEKCLIWETAKPYFYIRTTPDNRVIIGGEDEEFQNPEKRDALMEEKNEIILKKFKKLFPDIPIEIDFYWCGTFGETKDGLPYIGEHPKHPNTYFALGYGGNGITFSVIAAEIIRDLYLGKSDGKEKIFAFGR